jgi:hypothetical protein
MILTQRRFGQNLIAEISSLEMPTVMKFGKPTDISYSFDGLKN